MIEYDGEQYLTASEVAQRFNVSWRTCASNILTQVNQCYLPGRKRALYRLSDVEQFSQVRIVATRSCKDLPASATTAETGSAVTSYSTSSKWTGTASILNLSSEHNALTERTLHEHDYHPITR
jgi:hypothetical protein